ncbi:hypothetical protein [Sphingomonas sp.]|uniref:hypothetical protein n=1 Tax=Sphingomonas sp. TaxID=28214 RepID=UPI000DB6D22C|nr:hypothetical protein [Sphingomonas sp.]PZU10911.1 MAG: hypothetical protein DI605_04650 [Sphingomonas sp.]
MIGFHDYVVDRRSGRPEPHASWQGERLITWTGWATAIVSATGAACYYYKWREIDGAAAMLIGAGIFSLVAYARWHALRKKKAALLKAITAYRALLDKPFL